jgi:hypothetical protein
MAVLTVLFVWVGGILGGRQGAIIAFVVAGLMNFGGYWFSDKIVLRRYLGQKVGPEDNSGLYRIVSELARHRLYHKTLDDGRAFSHGFFGTFTEEGKFGCRCSCQPFGPTLGCRWGW